MSLCCPALLIAAPASGQGKTTVTAALARLHARQGRRVRVFKCGPDFLDPQIHAVASGQPCENLDLGMCGEADARWRLARAAATSDLLIIEGVMGLFDGQPAAADMSQRFGIPVLALLDAAAMAQTFGAVAHGLATYRPGLPFAGVMANRVAGAGHAQLLRDSLPPGMNWYGAIGRQENTLPERHLGLWQAGEIPDLLARLDCLADALAETRAVDLPAPVSFERADVPDVPPLLAGKRIAVARDAAFGFIYPANLETLRQLGAEVVFFSPLANHLVPHGDGLWLPGGYPELHASRLAGCQSFWSSLRAHFDAGKPLLAECGGMMILFESLVDRQGVAYAMGGLLPGVCRMQPTLAALGVQSVDLPEGHFSGHTFHYSRSETPCVPLAHTLAEGGRPGGAVYRLGGLTASYLHFYFPSCPGGVARLFGG